VPLTVDHVEGCPDLGPECAGPRPPVAYRHHVDELVAQTSFDASLDLTSWLGLDLHASIRLVKVDPTYSELDGTPKSVPNDIHHHNELTGGVGDPWLLARVGAVAGDFVTVARAGLSFPVGRTVEDPYELGREGEWHEHLQEGTGTFVPILGAGFAYRIAPVTIALGGTAFFNAYENAKRFRAAPRLYVNHRVSVSFLDGVLTPFVEATFAHEGEEYWHGQIGGEGSNVRSEIYLGGGLGWRMDDTWSLEGSASGRLASLTDAPTFESAGTFSLAVAATFDLWDTDEERAARAAAEEPVVPGIIEHEHDGVVEFEKR